MCVTLNLMKLTTGPDRPVRPIGPEGPLMASCGHKYKTSTFSQILVGLLSLSLRRWGSARPPNTCRGRHAAGREP